MKFAQPTAISIEREARELALECMAKADSAATPVIAESYRIMARAAWHNAETARILTNEWQHG